MRDFIRYQVYPFSPYYRRLFDEKGIDPSSIRTLGDLEKIPLTRKEDIMPDRASPKRWKDFILQPDRDRIRKYWPTSRLLRMKMRELSGADLVKELKEEYYPNFLIATSGTTGNNVPFMYTHRDLHQYSDAFRLGIDIVGIEDDWVGLNLFPFAPHLAFIYIYWIHYTSGIRVFHTGGGSVTSTEKACDVFSMVDANIIAGVPSYVYHFLRKAEEKHLDMSRLRLILCGGEKLTPSARGRMEGIVKGLGGKDLRIYDIYGTTEMRDGYVECRAGSGVYHIHPNIQIAEIVDPDTGKQLPDGQSGALAITNIDGRGTVVCRFLIGDVFEGGIMHDRCPLCGSEVPRLIGPIGRIRDYSKDVSLTKVKGTLVNLNALYDLMPSIEGVDEWQVSIEKLNDDPHEMDRFVVRIAVREGMDKERVAEQVRRAINNALEITAAVDADHDADSLFALMGGNMKAKRIADSRPKA